MSIFHLLEEFIFLIFDLLTGDSRLSGLTSSGRTADEKRYEFLMPGFAVVISLIIASTLIPLKALWDIVVEKSDDPARVSALAGFAGAINGSFLAVTYYILTYHAVRKKALSLAIRWGKKYLRTHESFWGMYIPKWNHREYVLSKRWRNIRHLICTAIVLNCVIVILLYIWNPDFNGTIFSAQPYHLAPFVLMTFLIEWCLVLYCKEDADIPRESGTEMLDLAKLLSEYQKYSDQYGLKADVAYKRHEIKLCEEPLGIQDDFRLSKDSHIRYLVKYLEDREKEGRLYPSQCLDTAARLLHGENVFFATPFYKDIDICIFFPIYTSLLRREKVLILLEDNDRLEEIRLWLKEGVEKVQNMVDFWDVDILDEDVRDADVGILPFQSICQTDKIQGLAPFLRKVSFAVVLEAADLLAGGQEAVVHLADKIGLDTPRCAWLLCDKNAENMLDLYSHLLNTEFVYVSATPLNAANMVTAHWKLEMEPRRPWQPAQRYLSIGAGIVEVAGRNRTGVFTWYGEKMMPVRDWKWIVGQYYRQYGSRTSQLPQQTLLGKLVQCEISGVSCEREKEKFLIVEDTSFNLYETQRQYATRGEENLMLHILSPCYMLRDFMEDRKDVMEADAKYIAQFVPNYINSARNVYLRLIRRMLERPVPESEVEELFGRSEQVIPEKTCIVKIREAVRILLNVEAVEIAVKYRDVFSEKHRSMRQEACYQLVDEDAKKEFLRYFMQANYLDEYGNHRHIGQLFLAGHLEQKYLPGQMAVLDGKYYEVRGFYTGKYEKALEVKRASEQVFRRRYYRQHRRYFFRNCRAEEGERRYEQEECIGEGLLRLRCRTVDITACSCGYMELDSWNDIVHGKYVPYTGSCERVYQGKQVLEVKFAPRSAPDGVPDPAVDDARASCIWLAALLGECFCTFFPQYCHLLSVGVAWDQYQNLMEQYDMPRGTFRTLLADVRERVSDDCFYIIEDSREDMGLLSCVQRNFERMVQIIRDYMEWSKEHGNVYIRFDGTGL